MESWKLQQIDTKHQPVDHKHYVIQHGTRIRRLQYTIYNAGTTALVLGRILIEPGRVYKLVLFRMKAQKEQMDIYKLDLQL